MSRFEKCGKIRLKHTEKYVIRLLYLNYLQMEKLIELLNEYEQLNMCRKFDSFEMHTFENSSGVDRLLEDTVISARYGFIKWLVENDKIDYRWMPKFEERSR